MNYRHAFHAGNFGDCMKHALLIALLTALQKKPGPLFVLDTHAGIGHYDLETGPASRTGEWRAGIGRLLDGAPLELDAYLTLVRRLGLYPGSPAIIRALLRDQDRLAACELHPEDAITLRRRFANDPNVAIHARDAWEAVRALLPPTQKRGLVLIDPPFEAPDDFQQTATALQRAHKATPNFVLAAWYPIKHRPPIREFHAALQQSGIRDIIAAELWLRPPLDPARLNGCGLLVVNPPFGFPAEARAILAALALRLGDDPDAGSAITVIADE